jgi:hypothetical protein
VSCATGQESRPLEEQYHTILLELLVLISVIAYYFNISF